MKVLSTVSACILGFGILAPGAWAAKVTPVEQIQDDVVSIYAALGATPPSPFPKTHAERMALIESELGSISSAVSNMASQLNTFQQEGEEVLQQLNACQSQAGTLYTQNQQLTSSLNADQQSINTATALLSGFGPNGAGLLAANAGHVFGWGSAPYSNAPNYMGRSITLNGDGTATFSGSEADTATTFSFTTSVSASGFTLSFSGLSNIAFTSGFAFQADSTPPPSGVYVGQCAFDASDNVEFSGPIAFTVAGAQDSTFAFVQLTNTAANPCSITIGATNTVTSASITGSYAFSGAATTIAGPAGREVLLYAAPRSGQAILFQ